jgi:hypothetical protein
LRIVRGYQGQETSFNQESAPVYTGVTIKSGMVMSLHYDSTKEAYAWKPGVVAGAPAYIAINDSTDSDVVAADRFIGISLTNPNLVFESGWFVTGTAGDWDANAAISAYAHDDGTEANRGKFKIAASGNMILGTLQPPHRNGLLDVTDRYPEVARTNNVVQVFRAMANHSLAATAA